MRENTVQHKNLFIAIETTARELEAKMLLGVEAAQRGYRVFIGSNWGSYNLARALGSGIMLFKGATRDAEDRMETLKNQGLYICVHDEEGVIIQSDETYKNARLETGALKYVDLFFAWGDYQARLIEEVKPEYESRALVQVTGHPRTDILRAPFAAELYGARDAHKRILINTKLAEANHRSGENGWIELLEKGGIITSEEERARRYRQKAHKQELLTLYFELVKAISAEFPAYDIVIRPHPSENKNTWIDFSEDYKNVSVRWDHSIGYWLNKADVIIHTGCTTAIEALIMDKPAISFKPIHAPEFDVSVPDTISEIVQDIPSVLRKIKDNQFDLSQKKDLLKGIFANIEGQYAYQEMLDVLDAADIVWAPEHKLRYLKSVMHMNMGALKARLLGRKKAADAKFSADLNKAGDIFTKIVVAKKLDSQIKLSQPAPDVFLLEKV